MSQNCRRHFEDPNKLDLIGQCEGRVDVNDVTLEHLTSGGLGGEAVLLIGIISQQVQGVQKLLTASSGDGRRGHQVLFGLLQPRQRKLLTGP